MGAQFQMLGFSLGGVSLPHVGGSEADDRRALVVVACFVASLGGLGPQRSVHRGPQRDVPASVLVDGSTCGQSPKLGRVAARVRDGPH